MNTTKPTRELTPAFVRVLAHALTGLVSYIALAYPAWAQTCEEKFVKLLIDGNGSGPVQIRVEQEIKGGMKSVNDFLQVKTGHWMTRMIEPKSMDWVLTHNNVMYTSSDQGGSWKKIRDVDSVADKEASDRALQENAKTVKNAECEDEALDGVPHERVRAEYQTLQNFKTDNRFTYWVNKESGWISKAVYEMKGSGFESISTQVIAPAPDLELPTP